MTNFKSGTEGQRKLAAVIRGKALKFQPWGLDAVAAAQVVSRLEAMTSPLFFIKNKAQLEAGEVKKCLVQYDEDNYKRRARFAQSRAKRGS
ncbi:hypothetical protein TUM4438_39880 [Shewanella sairae]|uniref:Uncharacterized protein n=1 Tax=Shewanella sairae TaxID=190310 RepID=A0ABQ4PQ72_9GAMM|nr:hypothetical protein [Shewanella sairae]MCL1132213.1 hypothetical protein [Shewanella sairae]GIU51183.1 hypothetical protein TUM4438_39880 [Shewanella sairae]